jgi:hydroxyacylglutathione hydrolase
MECFPKWIDGTGPEPAIQRWSYDPATILLRQSIRTHFEAPFLVLLVGSRRAMLVDTGTGDVNVRAAVDEVLLDAPLLVAHSHAHSDHVGGDGQFASRARTMIVGHSRLDVQNAFALGEGEFGIASDVGAIDLGDRLIDVLAIPGHEATHVAFYDRRTTILFTGDTLYPGRLTVRDWRAYRASVARLARFADRPIAHVIGAHIELDANDVEYAEEATVHPNEHPLQLTPEHLGDLARTMDRLEAPARTKRSDYVVVPVL